MSVGDVFAFIALMVAMITVAGIIASVYKRRLAYLERKLELTAGQAAERAAQYATHNATLENRVRVLERIVTQGSSAGEIAREIEALRVGAATSTTEVEVTTQ